MSLGKFILIFCLLVGFSEKAFSEVAANTAKRKVASSKRFALGVGFMNFSESLQLTESGTKDVGFANYAGLAALAEYTVTKNRLIYQFGGGIGAGKASAGGFTGITYSDGGRRTWTLTFLEFAAHYRINSKISFGGGMLAGNRSADWKSEANPLIQTKQLNKVLYAPEFLMRFAVAKKVTLIQSIASPDFRGNTIWRWSVHYTL